MYRRVLIGGVTAAVILGAGGTAMALTGSDTTTGTPSTPSSTNSAGHAGHRGHHGHHGKGMGFLRRMAHAQVVTRGKDGFVTHDLINGTVTSVSATSITVQAADKTSETFAVTKDTKVRMRSAGKGADSSISAVHSGDHVLVAGTGTTSYTAEHVVDLKK
jgi:hypothetical protein